MTTNLDRLRALHSAAQTSKSWVSTDVRAFYRDAFERMPSLLACVDELRALAPDHPALAPLLEEQP